MALRESGDHTGYIDYQQQSCDMIVSPSTSSRDVRTFTRKKDGAEVECFVSKNNVLNLVVVRFPDGDLIEVDPEFVDYDMIKAGLGAKAPRIL